MDSSIQCKRIFDTISNYKGLKVKLDVYAIDKNEEGSAYFDLIIHQSGKEGGASISLSVEDLKNILEACSGTIIGALSGDMIIYSNQREMLINTLKNNNKLLSTLSLSDDNCLDYLIGNIDIDIIKDDNKNGIPSLTIQKDFLTLFRLMCLHASLEINERNKD